jgi:hypothetical protein
VGYNNLPKIHPRAMKMGKLILDVVATLSQVSRVNLELINIWKNVFADMGI